MKDFLTKLFSWNSLKRVIWYALGQGIAVALASLAEGVQGMEPTTFTVIFGLVISQVTKAWMSYIEAKKLSVSQD